MARRTTISAKNIRVGKKGQFPYLQRGRKEGAKLRLFVFLFLALRRLAVPDVRGKSSRTVRASLEKCAQSVLKPLGRACSFPHLCIFAVC